MVYVRRAKRAVRGLNAWAVGSKITKIDRKSSYTGPNWVKTAGLDAISSLNVKKSATLDVILSMILNVKLDWILSLNVKFDAIWSLNVKLDAIWSLNVKFIAILNLNVKRAQVGPFES